MKILIAINSFGKETRHEVARQSLLHLKNIFPDLVDVVDIQFSDTQVESIFPVSYCLTRSGRTEIPHSTRNLPFINDIFSHASRICDEKNIDYFVVTNDDVIIMPKLIIDIQNNIIGNGIACSRMDIEPISSYQDIINQKVKPVRYEVLGSDTFCLKNSWFKQNKNLFRDYVIGAPFYDCVYAGIIHFIADKTPIGNIFPPYCFHVHHGLESVLRDTAEKEFNRQQMVSNHLDNLLNRLIYFHVVHNLSGRKPFGYYLIPDENEEKRTKFFFDMLNIT